MQNVFKIDERAIGHGVSDELQGCPFVLTPQGTLDVLNRYLQDLWAGDWVNGGSGFAFRPMPSSITQTAHRLLNFHKWCGSKKMHLGFELDAREASEADIDSYARHMQLGLWSSDGKPLSAQTVGQRQIAVIQFRKWLAATGRASSIELSTREVRKRVGTKGGGTTVILRTCADVVRRGHPSRIHFPPNEEVEKFLDRLSDIADQIAAKLALFCGLRATEVVNITISDVTKNSSAGRQNFISVLGKGRRRREVEITNDLYEEIVDYIDYVRPVRRQRDTGTPEVGVLLLRANGSSMNYKHVWRVFRRNNSFSPHLARHWYAVSYLLNAWGSHQTSARRNGLALPLDRIEHYLSTDLICLQMNLGHASFETTNRYLVTLRHAIGVQALGENYQALIDG